MIPQPPGPLPDRRFLLEGSAALIDTLPVKEGGTDCGGSRRRDSCTQSPDLAETSSAQPPGIEHHVASDLQPPAHILFGTFGEARSCTRWPSLEGGIYRLGYLQPARRSLRPRGAGILVAIACGKEFISVAAEESSRAGIAKLGGQVRARLGRPTAARSPGR